MSILVTPYVAYIGTLLDFKDLYTFGYKAMPRKLETQFLKSFEPSPAFKHSLNRVIKRAIGIIIEIIRTIIYQAKMPY